VTTTSTLRSISRKVAVSLVGLALFLAIQPRATAQSTTYVYAITDAGGLGTLNLSTGAWTQILGESKTVLGGLGVTGKILYGPQGNELYLLDQGNGQASAVGNLTGSLTCADFGSTTKGLYCLDSEMNLWLIATNGTATKLGSTGIMPPKCYLGMSSNAFVLYVAADDTCSDSVLYSIDPSMGAAASKIGDTEVGRIGSMVWAPANPNEMPELYAVNEGELNFLWILNTMNAQATKVAATIEATGMAAIPSWALSVLHTFTGGTDGATPIAGVTLDAAGNVYGTASAGGSMGGGCAQLQPGGCGTAFKLKAVSWTFNPLYEFQGGDDGATPLARVVIGPDGSLYGTTETGGEVNHCTFPNGCGTVFNLRPPATACKTALCLWNETVIFRFDEQDGAAPLYGGLTFDPKGNIYGTTEYGGSKGHCDDGHQCGTVYELTPSGGGWTEIVLYNFDGGAGGAEPQNSVTLDQAGNLYGTTYAGGMGDEGVAWQLTSPDWMLNTLYNAWDSLCGTPQYAGLIFDQAGDLYGAKADCGGGQGFVYELTPSGGYPWGYSVLYDFGGAEDKAGGPWDSLIMDSLGNLYGTTRGWAGGGDYGTVFKLTYLDGVWTEMLLYRFTGGTDGATPYGRLVFDANGHLYGTASAGGDLNCNVNAPNGCGVVFEITPN